MIRARTRRTRSANHASEAAGAGWAAIAIAAAVSCSIASAAAFAETPPRATALPPAPGAPQVAAAADSGRRDPSQVVASNVQQPAAPRPVSAEAKACFQKAQGAYAAGDLATALRGFLCAFQAAPSPELHYNLARVYERMGEADESMRHYHAYLAQAQVTPQERKRIDARLQALQELRERQRPPLTPAQPSAEAMSAEARAFYERGVKLYRVKQWAAAQAAFNAALQMSNAPELHFNLAVVAERMNRPQEAVDHYRAYLAARDDAKDREKIEERITILQALR
jgi:tetratricopeptide (TPR) repeat protein